MTTDAGSGFDDQAAGRDAGGDRLAEAEEESRHLVGEDAGDGALEEDPDEDRERKQSQDSVNDAFLLGGIGTGRAGCSRWMTLRA